MLVHRWNRGAFAALSVLALASSLTAAPKSRTKAAMPAKAAAAPGAQQRPLLKMLWVPVGTTGETSQPQIAAITQRVRQAGADTLIAGMPGLWPDTREVTDEQRQHADKILSMWKAECDRNKLHMLAGLDVFVTKIPTWRGAPETTITSEFQQRFICHSEKLRLGREGKEYGPCGRDGQYHFTMIQPPLNRWVASLRETSTTVLYAITEKADPKSRPVDHWSTITSAGRTLLRDLDSISTGDGVLVSYDLTFAELENAAPGTTCTFTLFPDYSDHVCGRCGCRLTDAGTSECAWRTEAANALLDSKYAEGLAIRGVHALTSLPPVEDAPWPDEAVPAPPGFDAAQVRLLGTSITDSARRKKKTVMLIGPETSGMMSGRFWARRLGYDDVGTGVPSWFKNFELYAPSVESVVETARPGPRNGFQRDVPTYTPEQLLQQTAVQIAPARLAGYVDIPAPYPMSYIVDFSHTAIEQTGALILGLPEAELPENIWNIVDRALDAQVKLPEG
jgi:hypothetical protein